MHSPLGSSIIATALNFFILHTSFGKTYRLRRPLRDSITANCAFVKHFILSRSTGDGAALLLPVLSGFVRFDEGFAGDTTVTGTFFGFLALAKYAIQA